MGNPFSTLSDPDAATDDSGTSDVADGSSQPPTPSPSSPTTSSGSEPPPAAHEDAGPTTLTLDEQRVLGQLKQRLRPGDNQVLVIGEASAKAAVPAPDALEDSLRRQLQPTTGTDPPASALAPEPVAPATPCPSPTPPPTLPPAAPSRDSSVSRVPETPTAASGSKEVSEATALTPKVSPPVPQASGDDGSGHLASQAVPLPVAAPEQLTPEPKVAARVQAADLPTAGSTVDPPRQPRRLFPQTANDEPSSSPTSTRPQRNRKVRAAPVAVKPKMSPSPLQRRAPSPPVEAPDNKLMRVLERQSAQKPTMTVSVMVSDEQVVHVATVPRLLVGDLAGVVKEAIDLPEHRECRLWSPTIGGAMPPTATLSDCGIVSTTTVFAVVLPA